MSGPVWRFEKERHGVCLVCLQESQGLFVEGEVVDNEFQPCRTVCPDCYQRDSWGVVRGERGARPGAPAYAHR